MKQFLLVAILFCSFSISKAAHITGGDFTIQHVSGNTYSAILILYRDCASGGAEFDQNIVVTVRDQVTNANYFDLDFSYIGFPDVVPAELGNSCFTPDICLEIGTYQTEFDLPNNPNGYYLTWERCCRNALSINLAGANLGFVFNVDFPDPVLQNSSPQFGPFPTEAFLCVNGTNVIDFGATDADGDELVYSFTTPVNGFTSAFDPNPNAAASKPWPLVPYAPTYNDDNQIGGVDPMTIDPQTGVITGQPQAIGVFTIAVKVEEFRNGVKIGEIRREIQLQSSVCAIDLPSVIATPNDDTIFDVLANTAWCIPITAIDPNLGDTLFMQGISGILDGTILPQASFPDVTGFSNVEQELCWSPLCQNVRDEPYIVTIRAFSRGCANEVLVTTQDIYINVILEADEPTAITGPVPEAVIDLYNPGTYCFQFEFEDPNEADSLFVFSNSPIYDLPNVQALEFSVDQGAISIPFCWNVICADVQDEPYLVDFQIVTTNCLVNDTTNFIVPIRVIVPENEPTIFVQPAQLIQWRYYDTDTFCFPVTVVDGNFFDTLVVSGQSELFNLIDNPAFFNPDILTGTSVVQSNVCWVPTCSDVRPGVYNILLRATSNSCKTSDVVEYPIELFLNLPPENSATIEFPTDSTFIVHSIGDDLIDIPVFGTDPDPYDTLSMVALNPDIFQPEGSAIFLSNGIVQNILGNFSWQPDCIDVRPEIYPVQFQLRSNSCQKNEMVDVEIFIEVVTPTRGNIEPIQNVFTPNGDSRNDFWTIENKDDPCLLGFKTQVYDRWGKEVYISRDPAFQWDGIYANGNTAESGTYFQTIEFTYGELSKSHTGTIEILDAR